MLFDRHRDRVFRHAYRICGDRSASEDVMATAFLELWRLRQKVILVEQSILPWLLATTTNVARNTQRASRRYRKMLDSLPRQEEASIDSGELAYLQKALDKNMIDALKCLGTTDLQLFSLVAFEGYTVAAAAGLLKLTPSAAKSRMHRARMQMKSALKQQQRGPGQLAMEGERS